MRMERRILESTERYVKLVDSDGVVKKVALATPAQFELIQSMRAQLGKEPLMGKPPIYKASEMIESLKRQLDKKQQLKLDI